MDNLPETKKRYINLVKAVCEKLQDDIELRDDTLNFIDSQMKHFIAYEQSIQNAEILIPILRFTKEGEELKDKIMELDKDRRSKHDAAIGALNSINRRCHVFGVNSISTFTYEDYKTPYDKSPLDNRDFRDAVEEFAVNVAKDFSNDEMYRELKENRALNDITIDHKEVMAEYTLDDFVKNELGGEFDTNDEADIEIPDIEL